MARRVPPLTLDLLERLEEQGCPARQCLTWALDPVHRARAGKEPDERAAAKDAWVSELLREWGSCGRVLVVDQVPLAAVLYAPPALVPGAGSVPPAPASPDAVLVTDIWVHPRHRRRGLGRVLVQATARDLVVRGGIRAVEAFAAAGPGAPACTAPVDFWLRTGFRTHRAHPVVPRVRMDLRSTVSWTLTPTKDGTLLRMEQEGFQPNQKPYFQGASVGWPRFISALERVVERLD